MGRFFSSVHIKNNNSKEQFVKSFCNVMKKRDLVTCSEDEASISYILAFSESGKWVTLTSEVYRDSPKQVKNDAKQTAAEMKTSSFSMDVIDSDWAYIELHIGEDVHDTVIVGRSEFSDDDPPKGRRECWEQLLASGKTWEQLSEIWNKNEVFVEDALYEAASMLGIDPKYMVSDYEDFNSAADEDTNIVPLFFKKKITVSKGGEKKLTLNAAFKQVFGEALEPLGFKMIKGRQPYFVRVVGNEILHIITYRNESADHITQKSFNILGGVITVYRDNIDLTLSPIMNLNWLESNLTLYRIDNTEYDKDSLKIYKFSYESENINSMFCELKRALKVTTEIMLPMITSAVDIDSCINYFLKTGKVTGLDERFEGLIFLKTENYSKLIEANIKRHRAIYKRNVELKKRGYTQEEYEKRCQRHGAVLKRETAPIENILSTPELYEKYNEELKHRKMINLSKIISYGINIK